MKLTDKNCKVSVGKDTGRLEMTHPLCAGSLHLSAQLEELQSDEDWRDRVVIREGKYGPFAKLNEETFEEADV